ncbi:MAG TPA: kynureninase [Candidatus Angelobacter sp.]|nr:kynureninase [Candidatus Angelobacter sp.]
MSTLDLPAAADAAEIARTIADLDRRDPLKAVRDAFEIPAGLIYLDGNSLGALARPVADRVRTVLTHEWGRGLVGAWVSAGWIDLPRRVGSKLAPLVGAAPDEVVVADSTSVNLFKCILAAADINRPRSVIVTERGEFPTDVYVAEGVEQATDGRLRHRLCEPTALAASIDGDTAAVILSHVHYRSALVRDMEALTAKAHAVGALTIWDLSHSAGAIRVNLDSARADFAVGCGYKYLNGGPGAPAFLYAASRHHASMRSPLTGWLGHAAPFAFEDGYRPVAGIGRFICGTPGVLGMSALEASLDLLHGLDIAEIERKGRQLGQLFIALVERRCAGFDLTLASPRDPAQRGCHVAFRHADGYPIMRALIERGVIGDFREPDALRFGFAPLYLRYRDVQDAVEILRDVLANETWRSARYAERESVT